MDPDYVDVKKAKQELSHGSPLAGGATPHIPDYIY